jgi:glycosyltransferase involved in cell wall biosynthesis
MGPVHAAPGTRRVLMLCYYYPPINTSGTARAVRFATHLPDTGWLPTVLSVHRPRDSWGIVDMESTVPPDIPVVRAPELNLTRPVDLLDAAINRLTRRRGVLARETLCIPDPQIGWTAWARGIALARAHDCLYASCSPFSTAVAAAWLKRITGTPLVLDFRDAWTLNPYHRHTRFHNAAIARLERWVLGLCDRLILNTEGSLRRYQAAYPEHAAKMVCIPNGFERPNLPEQPPPADSFTVMHVGSLYGNRSPELLLNALAHLPQQQVEFVQLGQHPEALARYPGPVRVRLLGTLPRTEALAQMRSASLLYLKQGWTERPEDNIAVAAKTYDYLATGLPVLAECPPGDNADLVRRYASRPYLVTEDSPHAMLAALNAAYEQRTEPPGIKEAFLRDFSPQHLTARLGLVLSEALSEPGVRRGAC